MMAIGLIGGLVSGVAGMMAANAQANAASAAASQNAAIAEYNRKVAERNSGVASNEGHAAAMDKARESRRTMSSIRAAYGASGLALEGSPLDVLEDSAAEGSLGIVREKYKGTLKSIGSLDEAENFRLKAALHRMEADSAQDAKPFAMIGALFSGIGQGVNSMRSSGAGSSLLAT